MTSTLALSSPRGLPSTPNFHQPTPGSSQGPSEKSVRSLNIEKDNDIAWGGSKRQLHRTGSKAALREHNRGLYRETIQLIAGRVFSGCMEPGQPHRLTMRPEESEREFSKMITEVWSLRRADILGEHHRKGQNDEKPNLSEHPSSGEARLVSVPCMAFEHYCC